MNHECLNDSQANPPSMIEKALASSVHTEHRGGFSLCRHGSRSHPYVGAPTGLISRGRVLFLMQLPSRDHQISLTSRGSSRNHLRNA
jgi:hypothetical protein